jgi:hypothetical protein
VKQRCIWDKRTRRIIGDSIPGMRLSA